MNNCVSCGGEPRFDTDQRGNVRCHFCGRIVKMAPLHRDEEVEYFFASGTPYDSRVLHLAWPQIVIDNSKGGSV